MPSNLTPWERPVFVVSTGRSGSTLLQRVLNVHPDLTIWGEHAGMISGLVKSLDSVFHPAAHKNLTLGYADRELVVGELSEKDVFKPWVSPFTPEDYEAAIRNLISGLFTNGLSPNVRWGFKEIRYERPQVEKLMELFPNSHVVILSRDVLGYTQSRFFAWNNTDYDLATDEGLEKVKVRLRSITNGWIKRYQGFVELAAAAPERTSLVSYADLNMQSGRVSGLFEELGMASPAVDAIAPVLEAVVGSSFRHNSMARANREQMAEIVEEVLADRTEIELLSKSLSGQ